MFLSSNNKSYLILSVSLVVLLIQSNLPSVIVYNNNRINLDLVLVFLTVLVFLKNSYKVIIIGFIYGLIQDLIMGVEQLGIFSFIKSATVFLLLYIRQYDTIWGRKTKLLYIFLIYFIHFALYYSIIYNEFYFFIFSVSFFQTFSTFILFILFDTLFIKIK